MNLPSFAEYPASYDETPETLPCALCGVTPCEDHPWICDECVEADEIDESDIPF